MRGRRFAALACLMMLTFTIASAELVPPIPKAGTSHTVRSAEGAEGMLASGNVELVATIPDVGATGGRFSGNYFITTTSFAFPLAPGPTAGLRIFDYTIADAPVLVGALPIPHSENEDVDVSHSRKLILVSQDNLDSNVPGALYVIDWSTPSAPLIKGVLVYPSSVRSSDNRVVGGPGHIANCIADCARYAYVGGARNGSLFVIDLADPASPKIAGTISQTQNLAGKGNNVFKTGIIHDVNTDPQGTVWVTGSGGTVALNAANPLSPSVKYSTPAAANTQWNQFIHHNSLRLDATTVLVTEEDWQQAQCGRTGVEQGGFQTWAIPTTATGSLTHMDQWITELGSYDQGNAPVIQYCSSHWFTVNSNKIVAVGWYNQGVRFLDVSNPGDIRQVGYWLGPLSMASSAMFVPGRDDLVYVLDYQRGIDVIRLTGGGAAAPTVVAPLLPEWFASKQATGITFEPHPAFGRACLVPRT